MRPRTRFITVRVRRVTFCRENASAGVIELGVLGELGDLAGLG